MINFNQITKPTLLLNETIARQNIRHMTEKAKSQNIVLRPHFKTHQSAEIGEWFREEGISTITVSSVQMAKYFARHGWQDITLAFPVNWREIEEIKLLAQSIDLGLLVESVESVNFLKEHLTRPVKAWIKIDTGYHRTGLIWNEISPIQNLANTIQNSRNLKLAGILTHAGNTYHPNSPEDIPTLYEESVERMNSVRENLYTGGSPLLVSVGDTPGCSKSKDLGEVDEIRPGNFIFFDSQQLHIGSCNAQEIAVTLACPVVARHPERQEIVIYGGAVHLSKDLVEEKDYSSYGYVALPNDLGWGSPLKGAYVRRLSQEHGVVYLEKDDFEKTAVGDLVCILPAHSCLTVQAMQEYLTLENRKIHTLLSSTPQ